MHRLAHSAVRLAVLVCAASLAACTTTDSSDSSSSSSSSGAAGSSSTMTVSSSVGASSTITASSSQPASSGPASSSMPATSSQPGSSSADPSSGPVASSGGGNASSQGGTGSSQGGGACNVTPPAEWSAPEWATNAASSLALRARLDLLVGNDHMRGAESGTALVTVQSLTGVLEGGDPSLSSALTPSFRSIVDDAFAEFVELAMAGQVDLINEQGAFVGGGAGGITGDSSRGLNEGGVEIRQIVDKALFTGAVMYRHAALQTAGTITPATVDALAAAWGGNDALDPMGSLTDSANYSIQMGYHAPIKAALVAAKAYAADANCGTQRDESIRLFFRKWEESMQARLVFYVTSGITRGGMAAENEKVEALHVVAEGIGLTLGFRGLENPASGPLSGGVRLITDQQIDAIMAALRTNVTDLGASTLGSFLAAPDDFVTARTTVEGIVGPIYGLTPQQVEAFRTPTRG